MTHVFDFMDAKLSADGLYRYRLDRGWPGGVGRIVWILCNPSTADAMKNDPTIRKVLYYSQLWGFNALTVVNMFGWRATKPKELVAKMKAGVDITGLENDGEIAAALVDAQALVLGWGSLAPTLRKLVADRTARILAMVREAGISPMHLGLNEDGTPKHPLYLANATQREPFPLPALAA